MENKNIQSSEELEKHLQEQIQFLESSASSFDNGCVSEAKRLAVVLRVLLHDTDKSKSLLGLLGRKNIKFYDSSQKRRPDLVILLENFVLISGDKYIPPLDDLPPSIDDLTGSTPMISQWRMVDFDEYWNEPILVDADKNSFSRKDLICAVSNKDGGAHIDPSLNGKYAALTRNNSLGWMYESGNNKFSIKEIELASIRQIAHEVLKTLKPNYPEKKLLHKGSVAFGGIWMEKTKKDNQ